jgi:hypothetical protein
MVNLSQVLVKGNMRVQTYVLSFTFFNDFSQLGRIQTCPAAMKSSSLNIFANDQFACVRSIDLAAAESNATPEVDISIC